MSVTDLGLVFRLRNTKILEHREHILVIGTVRVIDVRDDALPLIHWNRWYRSCAAPAAG